MKKVLPIGAVVLLNGAKDPLMIVGYLPKGIDNKERDYMGVPYPVGFVSLESVCCFNEEDIKEILFVGSDKNEFFIKFADKISEIKSKINDTIWLK